MRTKIKKGGELVTVSIIKRHREKAGLSFRALEEKTGIAGSRLHRMENRRERVWRGDFERLRSAIPTLAKEKIVDDEGLALPEE